MLVTIDGYKLLHWLNARKITPPMVARQVGLEVTLLNDIVKGGQHGIAEKNARQLAEILNVSVEHLTAKDAQPEVIYMSQKDVNATCRAVNRGGIHFYNYYTLPSPNGQIAPVLIDILCPKERLPTQNNGHLEPAITINLGPGNINGLWGTEMNEHTWHVLHACHDDKDSWIIGDSYVEPSFCPHTYSRSSDRPARILSYTVKSNLEELFARMNSWPESAFDGLTEDVPSSDSLAAFVLRSYMERRGYDTASLAKATDVGNNSLAAYLDGDSEALGISELQTIGKTLGFDYRVLLAPMRNHDPVGKTLCTITESRKSIRPFKSYTVASMSTSPSLPDLLGLFMKVHNPTSDVRLDLKDHGASHYLATGGEMTFHWTDRAGRAVKTSFNEGDAVWVGPYVRHGFVGQGSLIKMCNGEGIGYLDHFEISNTFRFGEILRRGWRDRQTWTPLSTGAVS